MLQKGFFQFSTACVLLLCHSNVSAELLGDLNHDNCFNYKDQKVFESRLGDRNARYELGDYNRDGVYNWRDWKIALTESDYQTCIKASENTSQPTMDHNTHTTESGATESGAHQHGTHHEPLPAVPAYPTHEGHEAHQTHQIPLHQLPVGNPGISGLKMRSISNSPSPSNQAAFRQVCTFSHMNYDDPIVYPNQVGKSHLHIFFGSKSVNAYSTVDSLIDSPTTCPGGNGANASSYWMPALLDAHKKPLVPDFSMMYYKQVFGVNPSNIKSFPAGLKIIAGDHSVAPQPEHVVQWRCKRPRSFTGNFSTIPETSCQPGDTLLVVISFPSCWDGRNLDSADHRSHMSYPRGGRCPSTHPVEVSHLTMNVGYNVTSANVSTYKKWTLASDHAGQPGGSTTHADYFAAWNPDIQDIWRKNCINAGKDCGAGMLGDRNNNFLLRR